MTTRNEGYVKTCNICGEYDQDIFESHIASEQHTFNFALSSFHKYKKALIKNRHGFSVTCKLLGDQEATSYDAVNGIFTVTLTPERFNLRSRTLNFLFVLKNTSGFDSEYVVMLLHPHKYFKLEGREGFNIFSIPDGETCTNVVKINEDIKVGSFKMPIKFNINLCKSDERDFDIYREIVININEGDEEEDTTPNRYQGVQWSNIDLEVDLLENLKTSEFYRIPEKFETIFKHGLVKFSSSTTAEELDRRDIHVLLSKLSQENYQKYFHTLLWLDETGSSLGLTNYNMSNVNMEVRDKTLILEVPGLAEKRPSVLKGDIIKIRLHNDHRSYSGLVSHVNEQTVLIDKIHPQFVKFVKQYDKIELDVSFTLSRMLYERMHKALDNCANKMDFLFPVPNRTNKVTVSSFSRDMLFQKHIIGNNDEQRCAVQNILAASSGRAPYIIFGPPGTGKTVTIVEAILQLKRKYPERKILVCASSNRACDMLTIKLADFCSTKDLFRVQSTNSRPGSSIDPKVRKYSNMIDETFTMVMTKDLLQYKIVVSTLHLIGKFKGPYSPQYLFIDEAAQATEPETCIPIGLSRGLLQMVLAGDPKQLGPVVCSTVATNKGLGVSLMERLMNNNPLYAPLRKRPSLKYNEKFLTMLLQNYRSHRHIIYVPNKLFYSDSLQPMPISVDELSSFCVSSQIFKSVKVADSPSSVEFCGVSAKEEKNGNSPSYFNSKEVQMVVKYVQCLLSTTMANYFKIQPSDIGIISPYIRQVCKIRNALDNCKIKGVEVGSTETFQGSEKRIILISTVRAQHSLLKQDAKYKMGFVNNERRFNVAITRAQAKLIIIGNPTVLGYDKRCWSEFIEYAQDMGSYFGIPYMPRTEQSRKDIIKRITNLKL